MTSGQVHIRWLPSASKTHAYAIKQWIGAIVYNDWLGEVKLMTHSCWLAQYNWYDTTQIMDEQNKK